MPKLERLQRHPTEDAAVSIWVHLITGDQRREPLPYAVYAGLSKKGAVEPKRPASVPAGYQYFSSEAQPKYTNGQAYKDLRPGQMGEISHFAKKTNGLYQVCTSDPTDPTKEETRFIMPPGDYTTNAKGELSIRDRIIVRDHEKGKQFDYQLTDDDLTKLDEKPL